MDVWVFGNPDQAFDALPVRLIPSLQKKFPDIHFLLQDPLDEWQMPSDRLIILDTVKGAKDVEQFEGLDQFALPKTLTLHEYDALSELLLRKKVHGLPRITIIGIPMSMTQEEAFRKVCDLLSRL